MEDGGIAETGLNSQVAQHVRVRLGTEGNGNANRGKSRSEAGVGESHASVTGTAIKKKRGRPKRYGVDGSSSSRSFVTKLSIKRGRGRSPGSSGFLHFSSNGGRLTEGLGGSFRAQTVTIHRGEEILAKLSSLIQPDSHALSIFSATGVISSVIVRQPGPAGGILSYEGRFEILALHGSFTIKEGGICAHPNLSSANIMLAMSDGRVFGGGVAGPLIAAGPTQLVVATLNHDVGNELIRVEPTQSYASATIGVFGNPDHEARQPKHIAKMTEVNDNSGTPTSMVLEQTGKEAKTTITSGKNDMNPTCLHIDEHNLLERVEPMLDQNMSGDTKAKVHEP